MSRSRNYMFTLNYAELPPFTFSEADLAGGVKYLIGQEEVGAQGTHHFQGYFELENPKSIGGCLKLPMFDCLQAQGYSLHLEPRRGTQRQAIEYCTKQDETAISGSRVEFGDPGQQGARSDLVAFKASIDAKRPRDELWDDHFSTMLRYHKSANEYRRIKTRPRADDAKTFCFLLVGPPGRGKSQTARRLCQYLAFNEGQRSYYVFPHKSTGFWCDDYDSHAVCLLDEMNGNRMKPEDFNNLIDAGPMVVPAHGGPGHQFVAKFVVICSNYLPKYWWAKRSAIQVRQTTRRIDVTWSFCDPVPPSAPQQSVVVLHGKQGQLHFVEEYQ